VDGSRCCCSAFVDDDEEFLKDASEAIKKAKEAL
jgi:hypothetical protein